jgi:hypothetical protein
MMHVCVSWAAAGRRAGDQPTGEVLHQLLVALALHDLEAVDRAHQPPHLPAANPPSSPNSPSSPNATQPARQPATTSAYVCRPAYIYYRWMTDRRTPTGERGGGGLRTCELGSKPSCSAASIC